MKTEPVKVEDAEDLRSKIPNPHDRLIHVLRNGMRINDGSGKPVGFSMVHYCVPGNAGNARTECGTAACIAGFASLLLGADRCVARKMGPYSLMVFLKVSLGEALAMSNPPLDHRAFDEITADQAIEMLEIHRDTGIVNWDSALEAA